VEPCPAAYSVDYDVAKSLSLQLILLDSEGRVIGDASDALKGSPKQVLEVPVEHRWTSLVLYLGDGGKTCAEWKITAFRLIVLDVSSFVVTIGNQSSSVVEVRLIHSLAS